MQGACWANRKAAKENNGSYGPPPFRRKCQTLQHCINRKLWLCRAGLGDRGQEPPPWGHTDGKVSHLSSLPPLLLFCFFSVWVCVWSIFELISHAPSPCHWLFHLASVFLISLPPRHTVIMHKWKAKYDFTNTPCFINAPSSTLEVANGSLGSSMLYRVWPKVKAVLGAGEAYV